MTDRNEQAVWWLWLQRTFGCGARVADVLEYFGSPKAVWQAGENDYPLVQRKAFAAAA